MIRALVNNWGLVLMLGILAILFGIVTLVFPGITLVALIVLLGAYAVTQGIVAIFLSIQEHDDYSNWWVMLLAGLVSVAAGIAMFVWPGITSKILLYVIAVWAIALGILELVLAIDLRREIEGEWALLLSGVLSVVFGILVIVYPVAGALSILWMIGLFAILFGALLLVLAHRLHNLRNDIKQEIRNLHMHAS